jgi:hypothetical protein
VGVAAVVALGSVGTAAAAPWHKNCTAFDKRYPHGVGKLRARDRSPDPVRTFRRSNALYAEAMRNNSRLDRDKDGVACEKE